MKFHAGAGHYDDGSIGEIFMTGGKTGTQLQVSISDAAVAASLAMQWGCPMEVLRDAFLREEDGKPAGPLAHIFDILTESKE